MRMMMLAVLIVMLAAPVLAEAKAELSGNIINIWSEGGSHVQTCASLASDVPARVKSCVSAFAGTCISVYASINVTRGGSGNLTNFTVDGCELIMNETSDGISNITSWGNFSINKANITTNNSNYEFSISVKSVSVANITNSFISECGWDYAIGKRGLELDAKSSVINVSIKNSFQALNLYGGANATNIANVTADNGIKFTGSSGNSVSNSSFGTSSNMASCSISGIVNCNFNNYDSLTGSLSMREYSNGNEFNSVLFISGAPVAYLNYSSNNTFINSSFIVPSGYGVHLEKFSSNNTFKSFSCYDTFVFDITSSRNIIDNATLEELWIASDNNLVRNINVNAGLYMFSSPQNNNSIANAVIGLVFSIIKSENSTFENISLYGYNTGISMRYSNHSVLRNINISSAISRSPSIYGMYIEDIKNVTFENLTIGSYQTGNDAWSCINILRSENLTFNKVVGIGCMNGLVLTSSNLTVFDSNISYSMNDVYAESSSNLMAINFSFLAAGVYSDSKIIRQWYFTAFVNQTYSQILGNANISVWNVSGSLLASGMTDSTGWSPRLNVTQYVQTGTSIFNFSGNHTITANVSGYRNSTRFWSIGNGTSGTYSNINGIQFGDFHNNTNLTFGLPGGVPVASNIDINDECHAVGESVIIGWFQNTTQYDDSYLINVTCYWYDPALNMVYFNIDIQNGYASCFKVLGMVGTYSWHLFLKDSAGNTQDYYYPVNVRASGACTGGIGLSGGGGGGGGGTYAPTPINVSLIPVITEETIRQLPATRAWITLITPVIGPFNLFQIALFAIAAYYITRKEKTQRDYYLAAAIAVFGLMGGLLAAGYTPQSFFNSLQKPFAGAAATAEVAGMNMLQAREAAPNAFNNLANSIDNIRIGIAERVANMSSAVSRLRSGLP